MAKNFLGGIECEEVPDPEEINLTRLVKVLNNGPIKEFFVSPRGHEGALDRSATKVYFQLYGESSIPTIYEALGSKREEIIDKMRGMAA